MIKMRIFSVAPMIRISAGILFIINSVASISVASTIQVSTPNDPSINLVTAYPLCLLDKKIGDCSLRAAIQIANFLPGEDTIQLPYAEYKLTQIGTNENNNHHGDLDILDDLVIQGIDKNQSIIDGNHIDRIFHLQKGSLTLQNLTLKNGNLANADPFFQQGTEILNTIEQLTPKKKFLPTNNQLTLLNTTIIGSEISIYNRVNASKNSADLIIKNSTIHAGIYYIGEGEFSVSKTHISGKNARIYANAANFVLEDSLIEKSSRPVEFHCAKANSQFLVNKTTIQKNNSHRIYNTLHGAVTIYCDHAQLKGEINHSSFLDNELSSLAIRNQAKPFQGNHVISINDTTIDGTYYKRSDQIPITGIRAFDAYDQTTMQIKNSTISNTLSRQGQINAIAFRNISLQVINSTISSNRGGYSSIMIKREPPYKSFAILNSGGSLELIHSTITGNDTESAIYLEENGNVAIKNSIISKQISGAGCEAEYEITRNTLSRGGNLLEDCLTENVGADLIDIDPKLGPLQNNGGATKTHALLPNSPAINAGIKLINIDTDQRGIARPQGAGVDIGAFEVKLDSIDK